MITSEQSDGRATPEFPGYANVYESLGEAIPLDDNPEEASLNRRHFLALSAAMGAAALAGCRRPDLEIVPYSAIPDEQIGHLVPGKPTFYATSLPRPGGALPVLVESHDGRPTKIEGHPKHPASLGSTDAFAQAAILDLYSPDRVMSDRYPGVMENGSPRTWDDFDRLARTLAERFAKNQGEGLAILAEQVPAPSLRLIREYLTEELPKATWHTYEPVDITESLAGAEIAFGQKLVTRYQFAKLDRILALDSDFLGMDPDAVANSRAFATRRKVHKPGDTLNRLYVVESTYTVTGTMADHRLRLPASQIGGFLLAVARELQAAHGVPLPKLPEAGTAFPEKWVPAVARDLAAHRGRSAVVVGPRQPAWVHALAHAINAGLGAASVTYYRTPPPEVTEKGIAALTQRMRDGQVNTLVILGGNPVLTAPADLGFRRLLEKVPTTIHHSLFYDHTSEACNWHLPLAHPLESWGDTETSDGTLCCVQPLIAPLNGNKPVGAGSETPPRGGRTSLEVLALLTRFPNPADGKPVGTFAAAQKAAYAAVRKVFAQRAGLAVTDPTFETEFNRYKQLGFLAAKENREPKGKTPTVNLQAVAKALEGYRPMPAPTPETLEVTFHPDYSVYDGRFAMNPWLQELPDPITKLVWDNAALISPKTAEVFGLHHGDVVKLTVGGTALEIPVFVLPGQANFSVALAFGQFGEMRINHVPSGGGTNVFPLRHTQAMHIATGCRLEKTGRRADLVRTQEHGTIPEGRDIVRDIPITSLGHGSKPSDHPSEHSLPIGVPPDGHITDDDLRKGFQGGYGNRQQPPAPALEKQKRFPLDLARPELLDSQFQWGMVIDLSACTGCSACTIACQAENNIPVVGKGEVKRNREMHWIRVDRYFSSQGQTVDDDPTVVSQPVACVHCEQAPCEQVCPVNAALHSPEGLNLQVYNRCIGTRYCSNACPYKVRRFNWFDYNKRGLDELRVATPFARDGMALTDHPMPESLKMQKNPDVTVRMRGVMEKCTYCVQRIERGKYGAKLAATEVAQGRRVIETDPTFKPDGPPTAYRKPKDPRAAGYDLDAQGRVIVPDGLIVTACQAACPTQAITFGNVLDPASKVYQAKLREGEYLLLGELNTKPRTSYLPRLRNPNPELS
jgi:molybdopterin-containing oxidoreductase family iron-sulfur binding subunit